MVSESQSRAEVMKVLDRLNEALAAKDVDGVMKLFVPDERLVVFATEERGRIVGAAAYRAHLEAEFARADNASFKINWSSVSVSPPIAWVAADVTLKVLVKKTNKNATLPARWTLVLENRQGKWLIAQSHLSAAMQHSV